MQQLQDDPVNDSPGGGSEEEKAKPPKPMTDSKRKVLVTVLRAAVTWKDLLNDFERRFMASEAALYAQWGLKSGDRSQKQWEIIENIGIKLGVLE